MCCFLEQGHAFGSLATLTGQVYDPPRSWRIPSLANLSGQGWSSPLFSEIDKPIPESSTAWTWPWQSCDTLSPLSKSDFEKWMIDALSMAPLTVVSISFIAAFVEAEEFTIMLAALSRFVSWPWPRSSLYSSTHSDANAWKYRRAFCAEDGDRVAVLGTSEDCSLPSSAATSVLATSSGRSSVLTSLNMQRRRLVMSFSFTSARSLSPDPRRARCSWRFTMFFPNLFALLWQPRLRHCFSIHVGLSTSCTPCGSWASLLRTVSAWIFSLGWLWACRDCWSIYLLDILMLAGVDIRRYHRYER